MPDDKGERQSQNIERINVNERCGLNVWSRRLGITPEQLKRAVKQVGPIAGDVKKYLGKRFA